MKEYYTMPYRNITEGTNRNTIRKSIELLSNDYLVNFNFMGSERRIELLETIANLTNIYFNMSLEEQK